MDKVKELEIKIDRYKRIAINLKIDLNIRDERIQKLERDLLEARRQVRSLEVGTQTTNKLEILGVSHDDDGTDPYETGQFKSPWEKVR
jgi:predicted RNase H-like nuclease (RuvC/YqgF family)